MSNSSQEFWYVNGTSLNTYAWAVKTFGGSPRGLPPLRGGDIPVAYRPGKLFRSKLPDSRVISLLMWTAGIDPSTSQPASDVNLQFSDNFQMLRNLFWTPDGQLSLTRQWRYSQPVGVGMGIPTMVAATAQVQIAGTMDPTMTGQGRADFAIDLLLADPYFYGPSLNYTLPYGVTTNVINSGDAEAAYTSSSIQLTGPLINPTLVNTTKGISMTLNTVIASGDSVTIDVGSFSAIRLSDSFNLTGAITRTGSKRWMSYGPGNNSITLTATSGSGSAYISFQPPYI